MLVTFFTEIRYNYYAIIVFALIWVYKKRYKASREILLQSKVYISLCIYFAFVLVSLLYSEDLSYGLRVVESKSTLIVLPILLTGFTWDSLLRKDILKVFVICTFLLTVYSLVTTFYHFDMGSDWSYFSWILPQTSALSSNYYAIYLSIAILALIFEFPRVRSTVSMAILIFVIFYFACFLALLASRAALVGTVLVIVFFSIFTISRNHGQERYRGIVIFSLTILTSFVLISTAPYLKSRIKQSVYNFPTDPRYKLFVSVVNVFQKSPVFGVGVGDVKDELIEEYRKAENVEAYTNKYNAHNDWLQILISTGLVGFVLFLNFFFRLIKVAWNSKDLYSISFLLFFITVSLTESTLERNKGIMFFAFFVTFFFIIKRETFLKSTT